MIPWEQISSAEGVIFDCDGTLVDSMPIHYLAWNETMRSVGLVFEEDRFYASRAIGSARIACRAS